MHKFLFYLSLTIAMIFSACSKGKENENAQNASLYKSVEIADAGREDYSLSEVLEQKAPLSFRPLKGPNENLGFTDHHYWLKFPLSNPGSQAVEYYLTTARPITDQVDLHLIDPAGRQELMVSGDKIPFDQRAYHSRSSVFKIELPPQSSRMAYMELSSDGEVINLPVRLQTSDEFISQLYREQLFFGLFYGILILAAVTYLFFYVSLRDVVFLYYGIYIIFIGLLQFALDGLFFQYFMPQGGWLNLRAVIIIAIFANLFLGRYGETFLNLKQYFHWLPRIYKGVYIALGLTLIALLASETAFKWSYPIANVFGIIILGLIILSIFRLRIRGVKVDPYFSLGIFFLAAGFFIFILNNFSLISNNFFTEHSSKFGTGIEIIFLSLSMTNRIRKLKSDSEEAQAIALKKSEEMNQAKSYFMSNMSHELRTPLNAIMGMSDVLMKKNAGTSEEKDLAMIKYSSVSLLGLVNDILDFSRLAKEEVKLMRKEFMLRQCLEHLIQNWQVQAREKGLDFRYDFENLPWRIKGDEVRMTQILNNVLGNALKFTAEGSIYFRAGQAAEKDCLFFAVEDSGVGIDEDQIQSMLYSFHQARNDDKRQFGGLGLGLSIVKNLTDLHGGSLSLSNTGRGTLCEIMLPFEEVAEAATPTNLYDVKDKDLRGARLLLVEDNPVNQWVIRKMISLWQNVEVLTANHGEEALQMLEEQRVDLIMMDLQMPVMDGYEATERIRRGEAGESNRQIPIIAVTADTTDSTQLKVIEIGMNDYMAKPLQSDALFERIAAQLSKVTV